MPEVYKYSNKKINKIIQEKEQQVKKKEEENLKN